MADCQGACCRELSLVVLIGVSPDRASRPSRRSHFRPTEVISSDFCRGLVADDENDQSATKPAFELLHYIVGLRLRGGPARPWSTRPTSSPRRAKSLVALAREHDVLPVAIVLDTADAACASSATPPARTGTSGRR